MKVKTVTVKNETGLHARPATEIAKLANRYKSKIELKLGEKEINAKMPLMIMSLGIKGNSQIEIKCEGEDELEAITEITELFENNFGEL